LWCDSEVKFLFNDNTNPNTNPKTLTTLNLTQTDLHDAFESFCEPAFCDFIRNYSGSEFGPLVTSNNSCYSIDHAEMAKEEGHFLDRPSDSTQRS